jgi:CelD/BcsL family acetyltransferase involved in cellulose biosynthesis
MDHSHENSSFQVRAVPARNLTPDLLARWSQLAAENPDLGSPLFAPEYTLAVASVAPEIYVGVAERGGIPIAFLPYQKNRKGIGTRLPLCDYQGIILSQGLTLDAKRFLGGCGLRAWDFDHLLASQSYLQRFHRSLSDSPVIHLHEGFDAYVLERRASGTEQIKKNGNLARRLEREVGPVRFAAHVGSPDILRELLTWRGNKYASRHLPALLQGILERLLQSESPGCAGALSVLYAGDQIAAAHFGLRSRQTWHYWFPAYNPQFEKYSPGITLLLRMAELAPQLGIKTIDLGKGDMDYKRRLANGTISIAEGSVTVSPWLSLVRGGIAKSKGWLRQRPALFSPAHAIVRYARNLAGHH